MYLKTLRVHNFKSFAGTTEIPFSTGFTGVAGPNGMGKSNVSDAILFVLGPPSSKALRADRLTRLFFNGGMKGKAATECEVTLVFDNTDRSLAIDRDEVEFTRYVKMAPSDPDGYYSYFYVNGRKTTQGEMDALLARARLSADGYNIVQQGEVNRIVVMSPLERRQLVERLAGIAQYDEELSRADEKKASLEANLAQLGTLLGEVERHISELDGQRTQALRYKDLEGQKKGLEAAMAHINLSRLKADVLASKKKLQDISAEVEKLKAKLTELRDSKGKVQAGIDEVDAEVARRGGEEAVRLKEEKDARMLEVGKLEMAVQKEEELGNSKTAEKTEIEKDLQSRNKELEALAKTAEDLEKQVKEVEGRFAAHTKALQAAGDSKELSQKAAELRKLVLQNEAKQSRQAASWQENVKGIESARAGYDSSEREMALAEEEHKVRQAEVKDLEMRVREITSSKRGGEQSIGSLTQEMHQLKAKEKSLTEKAEKLKLELLELNRSYSLLDGKLKERGSQGGSQVMATDYLLTQGNLGKMQGIRGKVDELVSYDQEYATAVSVAAGNRSQALVVDTDDTAHQAIDLLNKERKGRVTLLPLNKMLTGRPKGKALVVQKSPGCRGFALDLVKFDPSLEAAMWYVFGETLVMDTLENARKVMGGVRLVTLRGELIEASGAMTGGSMDQRKGSTGNDVATLKRLSESLGAKDLEEQGTSAELKKVSERLKQVMEELARHSGEASGNASAMEDLQRDLAKARERFRQSESHLKEVETRRKDLEQELAGAQSESKTLEETAAKLKEEHGELEKQYLENLPASLSTRMKKLQEESTSLSDERVRLHRDQEAAVAAVASANELIEAKSKQLADLGKELSRNRSTLKSLAKDFAEAKEKLAAIEKVVDTQSQASKSLAQKKDNLTKELTRVSTEEATASTKLQTQEGLLNDFNIRLTTSQKAVDDAESYAKDYPEPAEELKGKSLEELKRRLQTATEALTALGSVNTLAIEQYDAEKKRMDEFHEEVKRLKEEKEGLVSLVGELEEKKRSRLKEVITGVDDGYRSIYSELSGGGEGELAMETPEDPLKGGLLIRARPLGKKGGRLEQLSGGEKSLASLAFIFALQRYDPSPVYVLDEVDMSLDGINAENIGRMLRRNSSKAQFIVISLRKVTLKWAEHLFGVTMHGDGMSRVVGLRLDDIVDVDERELSKASASNMPMAKDGTEMPGVKARGELA